MSSGSRAAAARTASSVPSRRGAIGAPSSPVTPRAAITAVCTALDASPTSSPGSGSLVDAPDRASGMQCFCPFCQLVVKLYGVSFSRRRCNRGFSMSDSRFEFSMGIGYQRPMTHHQVEVWESCEIRVTFTARPQTCQALQLDNRVP